MMSLMAPFLIHTYLYPTWFDVRFQDKAIICISLILRRFAKYYNVQLSVPRRFHSEEFNANVISSHPPPLGATHSHCQSSLFPSISIVLQINPSAALNIVTVLLISSPSLSLPDSTGHPQRQTEYFTIKFNSRYTVLTLWVVKRQQLCNKRHTLQHCVVSLSVSLGLCTNNCTVC